ncbi:hypothetical protein ACLMAJ_17105 [Nocardia sp. KC 131]|uniref:hypothetical protein n=1 Tax=Nocardia arseniciresistens TaxID=3392119 RepID=UPI00398EFB93
MSTQDPGSGDRNTSGKPDPIPGTPAPTRPSAPDNQPEAEPGASDYTPGSPAIPPDASGPLDAPTLAEYNEPVPGSEPPNYDAPEPQSDVPTLAEHAGPTPPESAEPQWDTPTLAEYAGPDPTAAIPPGPPRPGSIQRQEAGRTQPRPPTVAEARARDKARKRAEDQQRAAAVAEENKKRTRKRILIGGVAIVGVAGLVGGGYLAYRALTKPDNVTAYCTQIDQNGKEVVVDDDVCGKASASSGSSGGYGGGIFIYNGSQYRYYYGGSNSVGRPPTGGTTIAPKGAEIKTKTGTSIQRGGLGSSSKSGSGS